MLTHGARRVAQIATIAGLATILGLAPGLAPGPVMAQDAPFIVDRDITYGTYVGGQGQTVPLRLDIYRPVPRPPTPPPIVVVVHGGGWRGGTKASAQSWAQRLAPLGYAVVGIEYRLSGVATWPAQIHDCKGAVRWIRAHAPEFGMDPDRIAGLGGSAGAHLVSMLGTTGDLPGVLVDDVWVPLEGTVGGNLGVSSRIQAVVDLWGPSDLLHMGDYPRANVSPNDATSVESLMIGAPLQTVPYFASTAGPLMHVTPDDPPMLIVHGTADDAVVFNQSEWFNDGLLQTGVSTLFVPIFGAGHGVSDNVTSPMVAHFLGQQFGMLAAGTPPVAAITASTTWGTAPLTVAFDSAGSADADGDLAGVVWSFADNTASDEAAPIHTFPMPGTWPVTLAVRDNDGLAGSQTIWIEVAPGPGDGAAGPAVDLLAPAPGDREPAPRTRLLRAAVEAGAAEIAQVEFMVGDTSVGIDPMPPYTHSGWSNVGPGVHVLTARATDIAGNTTTTPPSLYVVGTGQRCAPDETPPVVAMARPVATFELADGYVPNRSRVTELCEMAWADECTIDRWVTGVSEVTVDSPAGEVIGGEAGAYQSEGIWVGWHDVILNLDRNEIGPRRYTLRFAVIDESWNWGYADCQIDVVDSTVGGPVEICNGVDDDGDGAIDEDFDTGGPCQIGVGACQVQGVVACSGDGLSTICEDNGGGSEPGAPSVESCNGLDDDCDGRVDNGFDVGAPCDAGVGACRRTGRRICAPDGAGTTCDAVPGAPVEELCGTGIDENCDGQIDEGFDPELPCPGDDEDCGNDQVGPRVTVGRPVVTYPLGTGRVRSNVVDACGLTWTDGCTAAGSVIHGINLLTSPTEAILGEPGAYYSEGITAGWFDFDLDLDRSRIGPRDYQIRYAVIDHAWNWSFVECTIRVIDGVEDGCNGIDDDDDGQIDEDFVSQATTCGIGACRAGGQTVCVGGQVIDDCAPGQPRVEQCGSGQDDDCDGEIGEGFDAGAPCAAGIGACRAQGEMICTADGLGTVCDAEPRPAADELCANGADDDCDGEVDEADCQGGAVDCNRDLWPPVITVGQSGPDVALRDEPGWVRYSVAELCQMTWSDACTPDGAFIHGINELTSPTGEVIVGEPGALRSDGIRTDWHSVDLNLDRNEVGAREYLIRYAVIDQAWNWAYAQCTIRVGEDSPPEPPEVVLEGEVVSLDYIDLHRLANGPEHPDILKLSGLVADDGRGLLYAGGTLSPHIAEIDIASGAINRTFELDMVGYNSKYLKVNPITRRLYVLIIETSSFMWVDLETGAVSATQRLEATGGLAVDTATDRVMLRLRDEIVVFDGALEEIDRIGNLSPGLNLEIDVDRRQLYTLVRNGPVAAVQVIDADTFAAVDAYELPAGPMIEPRFACAANGRIYVTGNPKTLSIIDESDRSVVSVSTDLHAGPPHCDDSGVYVSTGYPPEVGDLPGEGGAFGIVERHDGITGEWLGSFQTGHQGTTVALAPTLGVLASTNTGSGDVKIHRLPDGAVESIVDIATSTEEIALRPDGTGFYARNRLGGSKVFNFDAANEDITEFETAAWPTGMMLDAADQRLDVFSHYTGLVSSYDTRTDTLTGTIDIGFEARTDALSEVAVDRSRNRVYIAMPEALSLYAVSIDSAEVVSAPVEGMVEASDGPGDLHIAVSEATDRVFVYVSATAQLGVYDGADLSLIRAIDLTAAEIEARQLPLNGAFVDDAGARVFVGPVIVDVELGESIGRLPFGRVVIGASPDHTRLYIYERLGEGPVPPTERITEVEMDTWTPLREWMLRPINYVGTSFAFDFERGRFYAVYMETAAVEIFRIGCRAVGADGADGNCAPATPPNRCTQDADCDEGLTCNPQTVICEAPPARECDQNLDCDAGRICATGPGRCVAPCQSDQECPADMSCDVVTGACLPGAPPSGCTADTDCAPGTRCDVQTGECQGAPPACNTDDDCPANRRCVPEAGLCALRCTVDQDCLTGMICDPVDLFCRPG